METIRMIGIETIAAAVWLIPIFLLLNITLFHNIKMTIIYIIFALYIAAVYAVTGMPSIQYMRFDINLNIIPFVSMVNEVRNTILNVILFIPLGCLVPLIWQDFKSFKKMILFGLGFTLLIEVSQLLTYRATDINDLITNVIGTLIGYGLAKCFMKRITWIYKSQDLYLVMGITLIIMFFLQQISSEWLWLMIY